LEDRKDRIDWLEKDSKERNREIERIIIGMRRRMSKKEQQLKSKCKELEDYQASKPADYALRARVAKLEVEAEYYRVDIEALVSSKDSDPRIARFGFRSLQTATIKVPTAKVVVRYTKQEPVTDPAKLMEAMALACNTITDMKQANSIKEYEGKNFIALAAEMPSNHDFLTRMEERSARLVREFEETIQIANKSKLTIQQKINDFAISVPSNEEFFKRLGIDQPAGQTSETGTTGVSMVMDGSLVSSREELEVQIDMADDVIMECAAERLQKFSHSVRYSTPEEMLQTLTQYAFQNQKELQYENFQDDYMARSQEARAQLSREFYLDKLKNENEKAVEFGETRWVNENRNKAEIYSKGVSATLSTIAGYAQLDWVSPAKSARRLPEPSVKHLPYAIDSDSSEEEEEVEDDQVKDTLPDLAGRKTALLMRHRERRAQAAAAQLAVFHEIYDTDSKGLNPPRSSSPIHASLRYLSAEDDSSEESSQASSLSSKSRSRSRSLSQASSLSSSSMIVEVGDKEHANDPSHASAKSPSEPSNASESKSHQQDFAARKAALLTRHHSRRAP